MLKKKIILTIIFILSIQVIVLGKHNIQAQVSYDTGYFEVITDNAIVYDNRGGGSLKPVGKLEKGQVYPRISDYGNWHRIQFGNYYGYVSKKHTKPATGKGLKNENNNRYSTNGRVIQALSDAIVYDNTSGSLVPFATVNKGASINIATDYGNWWRVVISDRVGYVRKSEFLAEFTKNDRYFQVITDSTIVYDNRGNGPLKPVGTLTKGQVYPRVSDYGNWHRIQFGDYYGYVAKKDTAPTSNKSIKNENNNRYSTAGRAIEALIDIEVYDNSTGKLVPFATVNQGAYITIATDYGNWWRVVISDRVGYVRKSEVKASFTTNDQYFQVISDSAIVYEDYSEQPQKPVATLLKGQVYPRDGEIGDWHRIQFGNGYAYVRKSDTIPSTSNLKNENNNRYSTKGDTFLALQDVTVYDNTSGRLVPFMTINEGTTATIATDYGNWWRIVVADRVGFIRKSEVATIRDGLYFTPTSSKISVYDNRTGSLVEVGKLYEEIAYPIVSDYGNWWRIGFADYYGYVRKSETKLITKSNIPNLNTKYKHTNQRFVAIDDVVVYDNTSGSLIPFGEIKSGVSYPIATDYGNWWRIIFNDMVGYVRKSEVTSSEIVRYKNYNYTLEDALNIQMSISSKPQTDKYRNDPSWVHKNDLRIVESGSQISENNVRLRNNPNDSSFAAIKYTVHAGTPIEILDRNVTGFEYQGSTRWYRIKYNGDSNLYVHSTLVSEGESVARISSGIVTGTTVNLRRTPDTTQAPYGKINKGTKFTLLNLVTGESVSGSTTWYEIMYDGQKLYIHSSLAKVSANYYAGPGTDTHLFGQISTTNNLKILEVQGSWYKLDYRPTWRNAKRSDVKQYLDPSTQDRFQHLVLSESTGLTKEVLNPLLSNAGVLKDKGEQFVQAGKKYSVNEVYLVSHALLETGHGKSPLATGVEVGLNSSGNPVLVTSSNRNSLKNIKTVYNMYGIGAFDNCALSCGAARAYNEGWFTVNEAIIGGAKFVAGNFFSRGQNTLYKMRWNPDNPGSYQYATDIGWAAKQISSIKKLYEQIEHPILIFEIPVYK